MTVRSQGEKRGETNMDESMKGKRQNSQCKEAGARRREKSDCTENYKHETVSSFFFQEFALKNSTKKCFFFFKI